MSMKENVLKSKGTFSTIQSCYRRDMKGKINTERSCEYMTPFGCKAMWKKYWLHQELMLQEMIEGSEQYKELSDICKKQCCCECNESCGYRCNQGMEKISNK